MRALLLVLPVLACCACTHTRNIRKAELVSASMDSVRVSLTGTVMLDGGCSGDRPLFALEMRTDTGWVQHIPFAGSQMLCGAGSWYWRKRDVLLDLKFEVEWGLRRRKDRVLAPGIYRLVFMGASGKRKATREFNL
ncbi:MAG: hypothetical protein IPK70_12840 [Flavobacteriales bacterium]|nr:hypothetical protein [Flavobacteriales bacterium]